MRLTLRGKLWAIVGIAAMAFALLTGASFFIAKGVERQLATIHERYLPRVELEPRLELSFETLRRAFQDAVAARDADALAATGPMETEFLAQLSGAGEAIDPAEAASIRRAMEDYYAAAHDVARRLMAEETGESLVGAM